MSTTIATCADDGTNSSNRSSLEKIESFINEAAYKEALENSSNYNTRLNIERRLRLPFIDTQTGVAQNHSSLFMDRRQRIPGLLPGQIYSYPRQRWRKKRRQYLLMNARPFRADYLLNGAEGDIHSISQMENPALQDTDSKDSHDVPKEWYIDELEMDAYDDHDPDSDFDYEESYSKRRRGRGRAGRGRSSYDSPGTPGRKKGSGRGRAKKTGHNFDTIPGEPEKPPTVEPRTPGRRGRPPNLPPSLPPRQASPPPEDPQMPVLVAEKAASSSSVEAPTETPGPSGPPTDPLKKGSSPYCDFCLGDSSENKKTGVQEELVSCSDCGRSGHPSCLQFTDNMKISVKTYRWQCIECKCCSVCGNSENDDQLLFCDDCDRGYHMYCLTPPLVNPPEGSWSCRVCIDKFHRP
ncbi:unnamed protein product [Phyllotreta striolata]|uniref:PHD-type domain-containing protein n=1 Tax=Phyllotreta striolata TaxID=444603 RepID=A0A9N9XPN7_PHYSR|nr:unnamed protein product [Phyllotreta striolata]